MKTRCDYCGETAYNQQPGNGCHTCGRGAMREIDDQCRECKGHGVELIGRLLTGCPCKGCNGSGRAAA